MDFAQLRQQKYTREGSVLVHVHMGVTRSVESRKNASGGGGRSMAMASNFGWRTGTEEGEVVHETRKR